MTDIDTHAVYEGESTDQVSDVYAQALIELGESQGNLDELADEAAQLRQLLRTQPQLRHLLESRIIDADKRAGMIDRLFKGQVSDVLLRFLHVVNRKRRLTVLRSILASFARKMDERRGIVQVDAHVAQPMDEARRQHVARSVGEALGGKTVQLREIVNPDLIGGLKLRIGDRLLDASVATQLKLMRRRMIAAGRERAREVASQHQA